MPKLIGNCLECGKQIEFFPSQMRTFCSPSCRSLHFIRTKRPTKPRRGKTLNCVICGEEFYVGPYRADTQLCCSIACANKNKVKTPVIKNCPVCGKVMRLKPSQAARLRCSKRCEAILKTKRPLDWMHNGRNARLDNQGYVMVYEPDHPNKSFYGWQYEHRLVAEATIGRYLTSDEHVHHINGVKGDNRPENLAVLSAAQHSVITVREFYEQIARDREELAQLRAEVERFRSASDQQTETEG